VELVVWAKRSRDRVDGVATGYGMGGPWFETRPRLNILSSPKPSRPAQGPTVPFIQLVPGSLAGAKETVA
jgi:hypothetical protein